MDLLDFRLAGIDYRLQNAPKQGVALKFGMQRKCETNPKKNGNTITSLFSVDFQITQEVEGKAVVCFSLSLRYIVWLESNDPITENGRFEGEYINDELRPAVYQELNHYLSEARLPMIAFKNLNQPSAPQPDMTGVQV